MGTITINKDSIAQKVKSACLSPQLQRKMLQAGTDAIRIRKDGKGNTVYTPEDIGKKFIEVLKKTINSSGLSKNAINAVSSWSLSGVTYLGDGIYAINISFTGEEFRFSLDTSNYGGISNIVALFNNGVDHTMKPVHGTWNGKEIWSRTVIPGAGFIEGAINEFMANYATEYNVTGIIPDIE